LSMQHLGRYLHEIGFRWDHRIPELKLTKKGDLKIVMRPMPVIKMLRSLLFRAQGRQITFIPSSRETAAKIGQRRLCMPCAFITI
jgi:hypothetical protein